MCIFRPEVARDGIRIVRKWLNRFRDDVKLTIGYRDNSHCWQQSTDDNNDS